MDTWVRLYQHLANWHSLRSVNICFFLFFFKVKWSFDMAPWFVSPFHSHFRYNFIFTFYTFNFLDFSCVHFLLWIWSMFASQAPFMSTFRTMSQHWVVNRSASSFISLIHVYRALDLYLFNTNHIADTQVWAKLLFHWNALPLHIFFNLHFTSLA